MPNLKGKKAVTLLRVSTNKQSSQEYDIPSQRMLVIQFLAKKGIYLLKEFVEAGVSGFKEKVENRDVLQSIKRMADNEEFDLLVVYKSDRLGRTTDESPLVIKYLNDKGIRVFTASGQELKTDTLMEELITYLDFWRNKSESTLISERVTDYKKLATLNGKYTGGYSAPFGYRLVNKGSVNEKGESVLDFEVDPENEELVKRIFDMSLNHNMGAKLIANWLNKNGYGSKSNNGKQWSSSTITYMLNNTIYKGYHHMYSKKLGENILSPHQSYLAIISEKDWDKNQAIIKARTIESKNKTTNNNNYPALLSGLVYCNSCDQKMNLWQNHKKYTKKSGEIVKRVENCYKCYPKAQKMPKCVGQKTFSVNKIDSAVEEQLLYCIELLKDKKIVSNEASEIKKRIRVLSKNNLYYQKKIDSLLEKQIESKTEIALFLTGDSHSSPSQIKDSITILDEEINRIRGIIKHAESEIVKSKAILNELKAFENTIISWKDKYYGGDKATKKELLSRIINKILVSKEGVKIKLAVQLVAKLEDSFLYYSFQNK